MSCGGILQGILSSPAFCLIFSPSRDPLQFYDNSMVTVSEFCDIMKRILSIVSLTASCALLLSSCFKEDKPVALNNQEQQGPYKVSIGGVTIGEDYSTQVYYSFTTGQVASGPYMAWDISFSTSSDNSELWMNGGKKILIYPTGKQDYASVTTLDNIDAKGWKYDDPKGRSGESGLGILSNGQHIGEVLIVDGGEGLYFKLQIMEATATQYRIKTGPLEAPTGSETDLQKDDQYNFVYYSFNDGIIKPEPPKKDWDILFTRYRHIYYKYEADGSDLLYYVNGVLTNPYKTQCGDDSLKGYEFYGFTLENAQAFKLLTERDVIGFDWKVVDINSAQYTVKPKSIFVIKDQNDALWKLHFTSFNGSDGKKGSPQFEFQRLQ